MEGGEGENERERERVSVRQITRKVLIVAKQKSKEGIRDLLLVIATGSLLNRVEQELYVPKIPLICRTVHT